MSFWRRKRAKFVVNDMEIHGRGGIINLDVVVLLLMYGFVLEEKYARNKIKRKSEYIY